MTVSALPLILTWFPIILGVILGASVVGRRRAVWLGTCCALFWLGIVQVAAETSIWWSPSGAVALLSGCAAMIGMGLWASGPDGPSTQPRGERPAAARAEHTSVAASTLNSSLTDLLQHFDDWLDLHRDDPDPWADFGEFLRAAVHQFNGGTHVRPFRVLADAEALVPLGRADAQAEGDVLSARDGIVGHVCTTGQSYRAGDPKQGPLVAELAGRSTEPLAWCFAVHQGPRRIGVVTVRRVPSSTGVDLAALQVFQMIIGQFWNTLEEVCLSSRCRTTDPVSRMLTRDAFLTAAQRAMRESYNHGEPIALATVNIEGLRTLDDAGLWELADQLVYEAAALLRGALRSDDLIGRFDGSRLLIMLRRTDSALADLIVRQVLSKLTTLCADRQRWRVDLDVRCGLSGSGTETPPLRDLVARAVANCHEARRAFVPLASDLAGDRTVAADAGRTADLVTARGGRE